MAEFQEVIKQMKRMCDHLSPTCNGCKLCLEKGTNEFCGEEPKDIRSDPALVEAVVMAWAAEHPEPVYPSWIDWLMSEGVIPTNYMAANSTDSGVRAGTFYVTSKAFEHIPADIAQKLGIEPKEAT